MAHFIGEKPYDCSFCDMKFTAQTNKNNHERMHKGERPYKCQFCDKKFTQLDNK